jgi:acetyl-CoA carboxylase biotin carboxyl carrier protein
MLSKEDIKELMAVLDASGLASLKYKTEDCTLELKKAAACAPAVVAPAPVAAPAGLPTVPGAVPAPAAAPAAEEREDYVEITAPSVGTFYRAPNPGSDPFVEVGSVVKENTIVCILEAMKLFSEVEAEVDGEVVEILAKDGEFVEYGQPLFRIKKG